MEKILVELKDAIMNGDETKSEELAKKTLDAGLDPIKVITEVLSEAMKTVGDKFEKMEIYLPEVMLSAEAMSKANKILLREITGDKRKRAIKARVVIGTAWGDIHDIGKNIVSTMLLTNGFEVYDLGHDVHPNKFIEKAEEVDADIIAISSLMTPSMEYQKDIIKYLEDSHTRDRYFVMIGGGPVTEKWARDIKADGYGRLVMHAIDIANLLAEGKPPEIPIVRM